MSTPEGKIKEQVKKVLAKYGVYWHCPVQNGMGSPSLDFICAHYGRYVAIETKAPGKKPTERQWNTMARITAAGGVCFVVHDSVSLAALEAWLVNFIEEPDNAKINSKEVILPDGL